VGVLEKWPKFCSLIYKENFFRAPSKNNERRGESTVRNVGGNISKEEICLWTLKGEKGNAEKGTVFCSWAAPGNQKKRASGTRIEQSMSLLKRRTAGAHAIKKSRREKKNEVVFPDGEKKHNISRPGGPQKGRRTKDR